MLLGLSVPHDPMEHQHPEISRDPYTRHDDMTEKPLDQILRPNLVWVGKLFLQDQHACRPQGWGVRRPNIFYDANTYAPAVCAGQMLTYADARSVCDS